MAFAAVGQRTVGGLLAVGEHAAETPRNKPVRGVSDSAGAGYGSF